MIRLLCISTLALAALALPAQAGGDCEGQQGYHLSLDSTIGTGHTFHMTVQAPARSIVVVLISAGPGPTATPYGSLCLTLPELGVFAFQMPDCDHVTFPHDVPCDDRFIGLGGYFQFIAGGPQPGKIGISNMRHLQIVDGNCDCHDDDSSDDRSDDDSCDDNSRDDGDSGDCGDDNSRDDGNSGDCGDDNSRDDGSDDNCDDDDSDDHHGHH